MRIELLYLDKDLKKKNNKKNNRAGYAYWKDVNEIWDVKQRESDWNWKDFPGMPTFLKGCMQLWF